jgi:hypothetical protein
VDLQGEQEWFKCLGSVTSSANLYVLVNDLLTKGVDWTEARQFFPICITQCGDFFTLSSILNELLPSFCLCLHNLGLVDQMLQ